MNNKGIEKSYALILNNNKLLSKQDELLLFQKVALGDMDARNKLVSANLRFVVTIALRNQSKGDINDLISAGNVGLIKAIEKFDLSKGFKFTTYAAWWINESIDRVSNNENDLIYVPIGVAGKIRIINAITSRLTQELGRHPTYDEIAAESTLSIEKIKQYLDYDYNFNCGDDHGDEEDHKSIFDIMKDDCLPVEDDLHNEQVRDRIASALEMLTEREQYIVKSMYEIDSDDALTLTEIGKTLNISRERARQINVKALERLKKYLADIH